MHFVKVLGSGGTKNQSSGMTSFQVSENIIIDAGNILKMLGDDAVYIDHIFLTHAHLDHTADLPFLLDAFFGKRENPVTIYASAQTIDIVKKYIFNNKTWPDFTKISMPNGKPALIYREISTNQSIKIQHFTIKPILAHHTDGSFGFQVTKDDVSYVISGDTYINQNLIDLINNDKSIKTLIIECSFPDSLQELAKSSKHLTPGLIKSLFDGLKTDINVFYYHLKMTYFDEIKSDLIKHKIFNCNDKILRDGDVVYTDSQKSKSSDLDEAKFEKMLDINLELADEQNLDIMLQKILTYTRELTHSDGGSLYLISKDKKFLDFKVIQNDSLGINLIENPHNKLFDSMPLYLEDGSENHTRVAVISALQNKVINICDIYKSKEYDFNGAKNFDEHSGYETKSMLVFPLINHEEEVIGVIQLINKFLHADHPICYNKTDEKIAKIFSAQAGMVLTNTQLILNLEEFLDAFVSTIASAIDAKSKHTINHITKISKLAPMIAKSINSDNSVYQDVNFTQNEINEIELAAKLHDIGKISMPETVMDKATKLHRIMDGIELVKHRIEILKRDTEIAYLKGESTVEEFNAHITLLKSEFEFIKRVNKGSEFMRSEDIEKINLMSKYIYTIDGEQRHLLSDVERYNLLIEKGTLTQEEKDIMNSHAQLTLDMLKMLPFPKKYQNVFHIAVNHHEKLNGKGYPRGLSADELTTSDRIMILSDIFEALTSHSRPYKGAMKLSEAFNILNSMADRGEIDKKMLEFFKTSQALKDYMRQELFADQIDEFK
ncbi:MAG: HD domain-containing phosphohydrolase [Campylobacter sp.]